MSYDPQVYDAAYDLVEIASEEMEAAAIKIRAKALRRIRKLNPVQREKMRDKVQDISDTSYQSNESRLAARLLGHALNRARWDR